MYAGLRICVKKHMDQLDKKIYNQINIFGISGSLFAAYQARKISAGSVRILRTMYGASGIFQRYHPAETR